MSRFYELRTNSVTVGTSSGELLPQDSRRTWLHIQNQGVNDVHIRFGPNAAAADATSILISAGSELTCENPGISAIQAIASVNPVDLTVTTDTNP